MILDIIKKRRAVYPAQYNGKPVPEEYIKTLLEAANWAPTHRRTEPWRFKVIQGDARHALGSFLEAKYLETEKDPKELKRKKIRENPGKASAVIAICMQRDPLERLPDWEELAATAMAVQNMWLCCTALGLGSYWSSPSLIGHVGQFLKLKPGERCLGFFYIGNYDTEIPEMTRGPIEEKVTWMY